MRWIVLCIGPGWCWWHTRVMQPLPHESFHPLNSVRANFYNGKLARQYCQWLPKFFSSFFFRVFLSVSDVITLIGCRAFWNGRRTTGVDASDKRQLGGLGICREGVEQGEIGTRGATDEDHAWTGTAAIEVWKVCMCCEEWLANKFECSGWYHHWWVTSKACW